MSSSAVLDVLKFDLVVVESGLCEEGLEYDNVLVEIEVEKRMKLVGYILVNNFFKIIGERFILIVDVKFEL